MRYLKIYSTVILVLAIVTLSIGFYWLYFPYKTIVMNKPVTTDKQEYKTGELLTYKVDYCKYTTKPAIINKRFIDGVTFSMPTFKALNPKGCRSQNVTMEIPHIPSGNYKLDIVYSYQVNPIRTIDYGFSTNDFLVVKGDE